MNTYFQWIVGIFLVILVFTSGCIDISQNDENPIQTPILTPLNPDSTIDSTDVVPPSTFVDEIPSQDSTDVGVESPSTSVDETSSQDSTYVDVVPSSLGSIYVTSSPSGAMIICDGEFVGLTPFTINDLSEGTHVLIVDLDGYRSSTVYVDVYAGEMSEVRASLIVDSVHLKLTGSPSGASVFINGNYEGVLPLDCNLPKGEYTIKVSKEGYEDSIDCYNLQSDIYSIEFKLMPSSNPDGKLRVVGSPTGASVFVNDDYKGITPLEISLPIGEYLLKITKDGYEDYTQSFKISPDGLHIVDIRLNEMPIPSQDINVGSLYVFSTPPGATIICDGNIVGTTPVTLNDLSSGIHSLSISMLGYEPLTQNVNVISGETVDAGFYLTPTFGYLEVITTPDSASVFIDGIYKGITPVKIQLPVGGYTLKIVKEGYTTWTSYPIISSGNTNKCECQLYPIS